ncbi:hypothetical protein GCM10009760_12470 [Kitasatospora kazusensis]|uniref:NUDIX hydrolase n=1 Tax=Kitasatospora kazusensis TaxID=407974 RepID=A0ABP5KR17_9ACTN
MTRGRTSLTSPPPRRIAGQAVLVHPDDERVLLLDAAGGPYRRLPGGQAGQDEPAHRTVRRLVAAQLGIALPFTGADLAAVDYSPAAPSTGSREGYAFVFAVRLTHDQAARTAQAQARNPDPPGSGWTTPEKLSAVCAHRDLLRISEALAWYAVQGSAALLVDGALAA